MLIGIILISIGSLISFIAADCDPRVLVGIILGKFDLNNYDSNSR